VERELDCPSPFLKEKHENLQNGVAKGGERDYNNLCQKISPKEPLRIGTGCSETGRGGNSGESH
jgi:hypothetical protein